MLFGDMNKYVSWCTEPGYCLFVIFYVDSFFKTHSWLWDLLVNDSNPGSLQCCTQ